MQMSQWDAATDTNELVATMSLSDKVGQLNMPLFFTPEITEKRNLRSPSTFSQFVGVVQGVDRERIGPAGGMFQLATHIPGGPREAAEAHNRLQREANGTKLGIPLIQVAEGTHGVIASGATVFPEGLALGSSWDTGMIERVYRAVAREARSIGVHLIATLVVEPIRDPRLGRNCEGYSEDTYQVSQYTRAILEGAQGDHLAAHDRVGVILCHYPTQSEPVSGLERGAMEISERTLREVHLRPWEIGLTEKQAAGVMATYAAIDGVPAHASRWLLDELLRDELKFEGAVFSEGFGFHTLEYEGIVANQKDAGKLSIEAGVDVNISYEEAYLGSLVESVEEGSVAVEYIDRSVQRILTLKRRLGLTGDAQVDPERAAQIVHSPEHVELARDAAEAGIVVLRNESNLLPLSREASTIAVLGPNSNAPLNMLGDYTIASYAFGSEAGLPDVVTVLDGIRSIAGEGATVLHAEGCDIQGEDKSRIPDAVELARQSDVAIVVLGEQQALFWGGDDDRHATVGEGADVASLDLSGVQEQLIREIHATGTPVVAVLINGRPLSIRWVAENIPAIVEAWQPGERGGDAVARILFGESEPSGRLPISVPRHVGQLPVYYNHRRAKHYEHHAGESGYVDLASTPLYPFGFGLSYTSFEYENLTVSSEKIEPGENIEVSIKVRNVGTRRGIETVQLYLSDILASVSPRIKELRGFRKLALEPGESEMVTFGLGADEMKMLDRDLNWVVEPGEFEVQLGASSSDIRCAARFIVVEGAAT